MRPSSRLAGVVVVERLHLALAQSSRMIVRSAMWFVTRGALVEGTARGASRPSDSSTWRGVCGSDIAVYQIIELEKRKSGTFLKLHLCPTRNIEFAIFNWSINPALPIDPIDMMYQSIFNRIFDNFSGVQLTSSTLRTT